VRLLRESSGVAASSERFGFCLSASADRAWRVDLVGDVMRATLPRLSAVVFESSSSSASASLSSSSRACSAASASARSSAAGPLGRSERATARGSAAHCCDEPVGPLAASTLEAAGDSAPASAGDVSVIIADVVAMMPSLAQRLCDHDLCSCLRCDDDERAAADMSDAGAGARRGRGRDLCIAAIRDQALCSVAAARLLAGHPASGVAGQRCDV